MAKKIMTLRQYIKNPSGTGASFAGNRTALTSMYSLKFFKVLVDYNNKIEYSAIKDKQGNFWCIMKIPSENIPKFFYDVIYKFSPAKAGDDNATKLEDYKVQFFSNDPAFTFTFSYAYHKNGLTIPELEKKYSSEAISDKPKTTNPNLVVNYAKILYFGYLTIKKYKLTEKYKYKDGTVNLKEITSAEDKIAERIKQQKKYGTKTKRTTSKSTGKSTARGDRGSSKTIGNTKRVGVSKASRSISNTRVTKTSKRK